MTNTPTLRKYVIQMPVTVNIHHGTYYDVYIGRGSKWGNPFIIGKDGDRATVIAKYRNYLISRTDLMSALPGLVGKTLGCYCAPKACHGDVLIEFVKKHYGESVTALER